MANFIIFTFHYTPKSTKKCFVYFEEPPAPDIIFLFDDVILPHPQEACQPAGGRGGVGPGDPPQHAD